MKKKIDEKDIELRLNAKAKADGRLSYKFVSPQRRSVPDRLILGSLEKVEAILAPYDVPVDHILRAMAEAITFIECKRPGGKPTEAQTREHEKLRARGFRVLVVDSKAMVDELYGEGK